MSYSVLIADDHRLIRAAWSAVIKSNPDFSVVAECCNGKEAVELTQLHRPDIVLMDINMPDVNGIEATQQIQKCSPASKVIGVSAHAHPSYARKMIKEGAMGYVTKTSPREELFTAMNDVLKNKKYLCKETKDIVAEQAFYDDGKGGINVLSKRELEVILLIKRGLSSKEIGHEMQLSAKTVEVHRYNILRKLNLRNVAELVNYINQHVIN